MAIETNTPEITTLKQAVEKQFGRTLVTRSDFSALAVEIEKSTRSHISDNTLRRLWGRIDGYNTVFTRTLDVLCQYIGHEHYQSFCFSLNNKSLKESDIVRKGESVCVENLKPGDRVRFGWLPDRICIVEYIGGRTFKAIECRNSTLQKGDTFECSMMIKNYPLFVDNLVHGGEHCNRYSIGLINGLTLLEKL